MHIKNLIPCLITASLAAAEPSSLMDLCDAGWRHYMGTWHEKNEIRRAKIVSSMRGFAEIAAGRDADAPVPFMPFCVNRLNHLNVVMWFVPALTAMLAE